MLRVAATLLLLLAACSGQQDSFSLGGSMSELMQGALVKLLGEDPAVLQEVYRCVLSHTEASQWLPREKVNSWGDNLRECFAPLASSGSAAPTRCSEACRAAFQVLSARCTRMLLRYLPDMLPGGLAAEQSFGAIVAPCEAELEPPAWEQHIGMSGRYWCLGQQYGPEDASGWLMALPDDLPDALAGTCNVPTAANCSCDWVASERGDACCMRAPAGDVALAELQFPEPLRVQGVSMEAPADGACEGGDEPCSHGVLGTWVFVSNRSISETSALPQSVALRTMAGLQFGTDAAHSLALAHYAAANAQGLCNMVSPFDLFDGSGSLVPNGTVAIGCGHGLLGSLGTGARLATNSSVAVAQPGGSPDLSLPSQVAAALPRDVAAMLGVAVRPGIAAVHEPVGRYVVLAKKTGGRSPLALCNLRVCARPASGPSTREIIQQITPEEYWAWKQPGSNATQGEELAALGAAAANGTAGGVIPALAQLEKGGG